MLLVKLSWKGEGDPIVNSKVIERNPGEFRFIDSNRLMQGSSGIDIPLRLCQMQRQLPQRGWTVERRVENETWSTNGTGLRQLEALRMIDRVESERRQMSTARRCGPRRAS